MSRIDLSALFFTEIDPLGVRRVRARCSYPKDRQKEMILHPYSQGRLFASRTPAGAYLGYPYTDLNSKDVRVAKLRVPTLEALPPCVCNGVNLSEYAWSRMTLTYAPAYFSLNLKFDKDHPRNAGLKDGGQGRAIPDSVFVPQGTIELWHRSAWYPSSVPGTNYCTYAFVFDPFWAKDCVNGGYYYQDGLSRFSSGTDVYSGEATKFNPYLSSSRQGTVETVSLLYCDISTERCHPLVYGAIRLNLGDGSAQLTTNLWPFVAVNGNCPGCSWGRIAPYVLNKSKIQDKTVTGFCSSLHAEDSFVFRIRPEEDLPGTIVQGPFDGDGYVHYLQEFGLGDSCNVFMGLDFFKEEEVPSDILNFTPPYWAEHCRLAGYSAVPYISDPGSPYCNSYWGRSFCITLLPEMENWCRFLGWRGGWAYRSPICGDRNTDVDGGDRDYTKAEGFNCPKN